MTPNRPLSYDRISFVTCREDWRHTFQRTRCTTLKDLAMSFGKIAVSLLPRIRFVNTCTIVAMFERSILFKMKFRPMVVIITVAQQSNGITCCKRFNGIGSSEYSIHMFPWTTACVLSRWASRQPRNLSMI
jgi:hypothetical protein